MVKFLPDSLKEKMSWFVTNQFIIAISALCLSLETFVLAGIPMYFEPVLGFVFAGSLAVYNLAFLGERPFGKKLFMNKKPAVILFLIALATSIIFLCFLPWATILLASLSGIAGLLYLYRINLGTIEIQIRSMPLIKNILLAGIWSMVTVLIPISAFEHGFSFPPDTTLIFLRRFFFILALAIPYDIRDYKADIRTRLRTLPVAIGIGKSKLIAIASLLIFAILVAYDPFHPGGSHMHAYEVSLALYLSALITGAIIMFATAERKKIYFSLLLDGSMILQFLLLVFILNTGKNGS